MLQRVFAGLILIIIFPVILFISLMILILSGRPIFFLHSRCGYKFKKFDIYKFRTMYLNKGPELTNYNDSRITKIGKILRKYKLDEFPQLINIYKGDMAFIGPRPEITKLVKRHKEQFAYLNNTLPGLSDIASIVFKDESKLFKNLNIDDYERQLLPIKNHLSSISIQYTRIISKFFLIIISIVSIANHKLSLKIISKFFLPYNEKELRLKLNYILSIEIF